MKSFHGEVPNNSWRLDACSSRPSPHLLRASSGIVSDSPRTLQTLKKNLPFIADSTARLICFSTLHVVGRCGHARVSANLHDNMARNVWSQTLPRLHFRFVATRMRACPQIARTSGYHKLGGVKCPACVRSYDCIAATFAFNAAMRGAAGDFQESRKQTVGRARPSSRKRLFLYKMH